MDRASVRLPAVYRAWYNSRLLDRLQVVESDDPPSVRATEALLSQRFSEAARCLKRTHFGRRQQLTLFGTASTRIIFTSFRST
ncbi:hypothetical protein WDV93_14525 [Pantoea ananatis]